MDQSIDKLLPLAEQGNNEAQFYLAALWSKEGKKQQKQAFAYALKAAKSGLPKAQSLLGRFYLYGVGVKANSAKAFDWFRQAAQVNDTLALEHLGFALLYGIGLARNQAQAAVYNSRAMEQGSVTAKNNYALQLRSGWGVEQNLAEAYRLFKEMETTEHPAVLYNLALFQLDGYPHGRNATVAVELLKRAAQKGSDDAVYKLAEIFYEGADEVEADRKLARQYLEQTLRCRNHTLQEMAAYDLDEWDAAEEETNN